VLAQFKRLGIGVILDNFGEDSCSLNILRRFPVAALKLSRALTREMQTDRTAADVVEGIVSLAHKMNMKVIVEGIETAKQVERLRELGCEFGQGSYFSQPLDPKSTLEFLQDQAIGTRANRASAS
jgi:EAL domain-containing protein (putative c-di-GMP-specific phosphodiesterase class I)